MLDAAESKQANEPKIGMVRAFTGQYPSVHLMMKFLELTGVKVVTSRVTTPHIIEAGTTFASAELCLPLRAYVGHVYHLLEVHPDLDAIVVPHVLSEDGRSSTCAKYRDVGGVVIRSLGTSIEYLLRHQDDPPPQLADGAGQEGIRLPRILMPTIRSLDKSVMRNACYDVYADIRGWSPRHKAALFLPRRLRSSLAPEVARMDAALDQAYSQVLGRRANRVTDLTADESRPRLGLVGRPYLVNDPALTLDMKKWFQKRGIAVITARDVPTELLARDEVDGYYDNHKESEAFIRWGIDKLDGFICVGSFGCHPDAFQVEYLAEYVRSRNGACWTFRFDETAGAAGFHTRFETIVGFLEKRRDQRLTGEVAATPEPPQELTNGGDPARTPLFIWPYMGETLNLLMDECAHQLGLEEFMYPPAPLTGEAMDLGNNRYVESCSPYACSTGSLKHTLVRALDELEGSPPRSIIMLMLRGEGPCTFGWYSIVQKKHIPVEFADALAKGGHTLEMATVGMKGVLEFLRRLRDMGNSAALDPILDYFEMQESASPVPRWQRELQRVRFLTALRRLSRPVWAKLDAVESLRARSLILRAHELTPGSTTIAYRQALALMRGAHSRQAIRAAYGQGMALLDAVPHDQKPKPRVVSVGEIYVVLTSFANRGTVENLLAREGVEIVEGTTLGKFIRHSLREMKRRAWTANPVLHPILAWLMKHNVRLFEERLRDPKARPFLVHEVGGEGIPTVGRARHYVEEGCQGILHLHPFMCMPEGIAKDALKEIAAFYGVRYLGLSFDKEIEIERLKTEISTFAALLYAEMARAKYESVGSEIARRRRLGRLVTREYRAYRAGRHTD